jgi:hypothetical protein
MGNPYNYSNIAPDTKAGAGSFGSAEARRLARAARGGTRLKGITAPHAAMPGPGGTRVPMRSEQMYSLLNKNPGFLGNPSRAQSALNTVSDYDNLRRTKSPVDALNDIGRRHGPTKRNLLMELINKGAIQANNRASQVGGVV